MSRQFLRTLCALAAFSASAQIALITITTTTLPNARVGAAYNQPLNANNGRRPFTWAVTVGSLPAGLTIDSNAGTISGTPTTPGLFNFTVTVTDRDGVTDTQALGITVDPAPIVVTTASPLPPATVGSPYSQTLAATGGSGSLTWTVTAGTLPAGLALSAAGTISGTPTAAGPSNFTVTATDSGKRTGSKPLSIAVNLAPLTITTPPLPNGTIGTAYSQSFAATGGSGGYTWTSTGTLPAGLTLSAGGVLSGTPTATGTANVTVTVTDSGNRTASKPFAITIDPAALTVTTPSLPNGQVGVAYSQTLAASGGSGGNTWTSSGALPAGLSLSPAGVISGTPTAPGTANFTVTVTDSAKHTASKPLTITVDPATLTVTTPSLPDGQVGVAYSQNLTASGGTGGNTWSVSAGAPPAGLTLSAAGAITGTPTTPGASNFTVSVADNGGHTATKALSITIASATLTVTTPSLPDGQVGVAYSQNLTASGGTGGNTWSVSAGAPPAGLTLSAAGAITGTPTAPGTSNFTVSVADNGGHTATKALSILIAPPGVTITTASLPNATVGVAYSQSLAAAGGTGGFTWSVTGGTLPPGLTLSGAGAITGTPTTAGTSNFTVQATDSGSRSATKALSIVVAAPSLVISTASLPLGVVGVSYLQTLAATGGSAPITWSVSGGTLPAGLSLSPGGALSGTPTAPGSSSFTIQAKDTAGTTVTRAFTMIIAPPLVTITTQNLSGGEIGAAYSQTLTASGGTGPYIWSVSAGSLPAGLTLDPAGRISGTPTGATSTFNLLVTESLGGTAEKSFTIPIGPAPSLPAQTALPDGVLNLTYAATVAVTGGQSPYTFAVLSGQLPAGLTLNSATGDIGGKPTQAGSYNFTLQARDVNGAQTQGAFSINVANGLTITTAPVLPNASISVAYQAPIAAAGGAAPYSFSVTAGALPGGLTFHPDGKIDGTPSAAGSFTFTVKVTDATGATATKDFSLTVAASLTISTGPQLPPGFPGVSYTATLSAAGGSPPYVWSVTAGALPGGLTLDAKTGVLTGSPAAAGDYSFTATVTDSVNLSAQKAFKLSIAPGLSITSSAAIPDAVAGQPYTFTLQASGGTAPYSWRITDGALPDGISLNGSTGVISGTATASGTFNFTVELSDAGGLKTSRVHTLVVGLPGSPTLSLTGLGSTVAALQQPAIDVTLSAPYPVAITGRLNLSFSPANGMPDDPAVQFSSGGRTASFTIPANATHATFPVSQMAVQTGSVAGSIQITFEAVSAGSTTLPSPAAQTAQCPASAAIVRRVSVTRTAGGFQVEVVGLSNTRELASATVRFKPSPGATLDTSEVTLPLGDPSRAWFQGSTSTAFGGQFTLTLPFSIAGGSAPLDSVVVILTNGVGASQEISAPY